MLFYLSYIEREYPWFQAVATFFAFAKNSRPAGAMDVKFRTAMNGGGSTQ